MRTDALKSPLVTQDTTAGVCGASITSPSIVDGERWE